MTEKSITSLLKQPKKILSPTNDSQTACFGDCDVTEEGWALIRQLNVPSQKNDEKYKWVSCSYCDAKFCPPCSCLQMLDLHEAGCGSSVSKFSEDEDFDALGELRIGYCCTNGCQKRFVPYSVKVCFTALHKNQ